MSIGIGTGLLLLGLGVVAGAGVAALVLVPRMEDLEDENSALSRRIDSLNIQIEAQRGHILSLRNYARFKDQELSALENDWSDLSRKYDLVISELEDFKAQVQSEEAEKLLAILVERARQRKTQRVQVQTALSSIQ